MSGFNMSYPGFTIDVEQQWIDVSTISERDPDWKHIDAKGHGHYFHSDATPYPTLKWHKHMVSDEDGETWDAGWYQCARCRERITPGSRSGMGRQMPGMKTITLTIDGIGVPITKRECDAIVAASSDTARQIWESRK